MALTLNGKGEIAALTLKREGQTITSGTGGIVLFDGNTEREYRSRGVRNKMQRNGGMSFEHVVDADHLEVCSELSQANGGMIWTVHVENTSEERQLVELRLALPVRLTGTWRYWDGDWRSSGEESGELYPDHVRAQEWHGLREVNENSSFYPRKAWPVVWKAKGKSRITDPAEMGLKPFLGECFCFPAQTLMKGRLGIAVAFAPGPYRGYATGGCQPYFGSYDTLYAATKLVLSPGEKDHVPFAIFAYEPTYGHRSCVAAYHRMFPSYFRHGPEVNPKYRLAEMQGFIGLLHPVPALREYVRRRHMGWQWTYVPFLHTGRWLPRSDNEVSRPRSKLLGRITKEGYPPTIKGYRQFFIDGTRATRRFATANFYVILESLNAEIARAEYPESVAVDRRGGKFKPVGESITGEAVTLMFAAGKKYGERSRRDLADLIKVIGASGIAFDNCTGYQLHWGEDAADEPGAFFVDRRICARLGTVMYKAMEAVDSVGVKIDGYAPGIVANNPGDWWLAWHCEASLNEYSPLSQMYDNRSYHRPEWFEAQRYLMGSKTMSMHSGVMDLKRARYAPKGISEEEYQARGTRELVMHLVRFGVYLHVRGYDSKAKPKEALATVPLVRKFHEVGGWRPESGMSSETRLWLERFGDGVNSYAVIVNPEDEAKEATVRFDPDLFGGHPFFGRAFGNADFVASVSRAGAVVRTTLGPQDTLVLETLACVKEAPGATLSLQADTGRSRLVMRFPQKLDQELEAEFPLPLGASVKQVLVDAKPVAHRQEGRVVQARLPAGTMAVTVGLRREIADGASTAALKDFPFMTDGRPTFEILIADRRDEISLDTADRLRAYFDYLYLGGQVQQWITRWGGTAVTEFPEDYRAAVSAAAVPTRPDRARVVLGKKALAQLPDAAELEKQAADLPPNGWAILRAQRPTLYIFGRDAETRDRSMLRVLEVLDEKYPDRYFGEEADYQLAQLPEATVHFPCDAIENGVLRDTSPLKNTGYAGRSPSEDEEDIQVGELAGRRALIFTREKKGVAHVRTSKGWLSALRGGFTIEAWVCPTLKRRKMMTIVSGAGGWLHLRSGMLCYRQSGLDIHLVTTPRDAVPLNKWSQVAVTHDGKTTRLYINGKLCGTRDVELPMPSIAGRYQVGAHGSKPNHYLHGGIRDIRFANFEKKHFRPSGAMSTPSNHRSPPLLPAP